jgi:hypothetical protein
MGAEERRARAKPQRAHEVGRRAQFKLSKGLRRTRTTARHLVVSDGGTTLAFAPALVWKTHLAAGRSRTHPPVAASIAQSRISAPARVEELKHWFLLMNRQRRQPSDAARSRFFNSWVDSFAANVRSACHESHKLRRVLSRRSAVISGMHVLRFLFVLRR